MPIHCTLENPFGYDENDLQMDRLCAMLRAETEMYISQEPMNFERWMSNAVVLQDALTSKATKKVAAESGLRRQVSINDSDIGTDGESIQSAQSSPILPPSSGHSTPKLQDRPVSRAFDVDVRLDMIDEVQETVSIRSKTDDSSVPIVSPTKTRPEQFERFLEDE
jgi:hypothetical protein